VVDEAYPTLTEVPERLEVSSRADYRWIQAGEKGVGMNITVVGSGTAVPRLARRQFPASCGGGSEEFTAPTEKTEIIEDTSAAEATSLANVPSKDLQRRAEE